MANFFFSSFVRSFAVSLLSYPLDRDVIFIFTVWFVVVVVFVAVRGERTHRLVCLVHFPIPLRCELFSSVSIYTTSMVRMWRNHALLL